MGRAGLALFRRGVGDGWCRTTVLRGGPSRDITVCGRFQSKTRKSLRDDEKNRSFGPLVMAWRLTTAALAAVSEAQTTRPVLPWRRDMERRCPGPGPNPQPAPQPGPDPEPQPIDDGGAPNVEPEPAVFGVDCGTLPC
jgi:hypothetical protein